MGPIWGSCWCTGLAQLWRYVAHDWRGTSGNFYFLMSSGSIKPKGCGIFCFGLLCFFSFLQNSIKKHNNILQKRIKISQGDFCLVKIENYFNKLSFSPDFSSCHFFSNTLRHSVKITILFGLSFTICLREKKQQRKLAHLCILWCQQNLHQIHMHISQYRNSCMCGRGKCHLALKILFVQVLLNCK